MAGCRGLLREESDDRRDDGGDIRPLVSTRARGARLLSSRVCASLRFEPEQCQQVAPGGSPAPYQHRGPGNRRRARRPVEEILAQAGVARVSGDADPPRQRINALVELLPDDRLEIVGDILEGLCAGERRRMQEGSEGLPVRGLVPLGAWLGKGGHGVMCETKARPRERRSE